MLAAQMEPARQTFDPAGAGALLITGTAAGTGAGALIGWAAGSVGYGLLAVGASIYMVYLLEIVKLANPRVRRRRREAEERERRSA